MSEDGDLATDGAPATGTANVREWLSVRRGAAWQLIAARLGLGATTVRVIVGIAVVGLVARLASLGARGAHYDEGRVAYWTLRSAETGHFQYRYIIHGPLVQHVDRWLFAVLGPSDAVARLPVALVGGALPLVVLWYRDHLSETELIGMAGLLAANPILLYYSRFLRSDVLVATFVLAALGALLRLHATRRPAYLYATTAALALGVASKENAIVYVLCWLGAAALVSEAYLFRPRDHPTGLALLRDRVGTLRTRLAVDDRSTHRLWAGHLAGSVALFALLVVLLFAPRAGTAGGPGLWRVLGDPAHLPALLRATAYDIGSGYAYWFGGAAEPNCGKELLVLGYACFLGRMATTMALFGSATATLAVVGFLRERYAVERPRPVIVFAFVWGVASFLGYPLGTDVWAAWVATHVVVPLSIPAAVGFAALVGLAGRGLAADRREFVAVPVALLLVLGAWTGVAAVDTSYVDDSTRDHPADMVQFAQPEREIKPAVAAMTVAVADNEDGPDVVYHGSLYYLEDESVADQPPIGEGNGGWFKRLPLPWYTESIDAEVASTRTVTGLEDHLASRPPVVIAQGREAGAVNSRVQGYRTFAFDLRAHESGTGDRTRIVVFVDERRLENDGRFVTG